VIDAAPRFGPLPASADLVIVGGGIVGCATAFFAVRAGLRVVVLERRPALATLTTPASTGAFRLQFDNPEEVALVREGVELWDDFAARTGLPGWDLAIRHGGYLFCSLTDATVERSHRLVARQRTWGLTDVEILSGDEARSRWPWLSPQVRGARYRAGDGWLDPKRLAIGYATAAGAGATFVTACAVAGFELSADGSRLRGVRTSRGTVATDAAVLATGPFLAPVAGLAGMRLDVRPTRRQKLLVPEMAAIPHDAPMTIDEETAAHWRPWQRGCLALFTDPTEQPDEPRDPVAIDQAWAFDLLDPSSEHALARVAPLWAAAWHAGSVQGWSLQAGQYEVTPDRRPYLGPAGGIGPDGIHLNGGYSGHGIMASTAGSRMVVDAIMGHPDPLAAAFRTDRTITEREHDIL
jgi:sarcosine oxidase subunit beta